MGYTSTDIWDSITWIWGQVVNFFKSIVGDNSVSIGETSVWSGGAILVIGVLGGTCELAMAYPSEISNVIMELCNIPNYAWNWSVDTSAEVNYSILKELADIFNFYAEKSKILGEILTVALWTNQTHSSIFEPTPEYKVDSYKNE